MNRRGEFLEYVLSSMFAMIGQSIYILADTYFVAKGLGANGLAALNLAIPIYNFINGVGLMIGIGGATRFIISRTVGDAERSRRIYTTAAVSGVLVGLCFSLLGIFFVDPLTVLLGAKAETYEMTKIYLRMVLLFAPAFISNSIFSAFVKNDGGPKLAMLGMIAGSVFNTIFDYIFIFPMGLGIFGAVLATVFSPVMGILVLSLHLIRKKSSFYPVKRGYRFEELRRMLSLGVSSLISEITTGIVMIVFNIIILHHHSAPRGQCRGCGLRRPGKHHPRCDCGLQRHCTGIPAAIRALFRVARHRKVASHLSRRLDCGRTCLGCLLCRNDGLPRTDYGAL